MKYIMKNRYESLNEHQEEKKKYNMNILYPNTLLESDIFEKNLDTISHKYGCDLIMYNTKTRNTEVYSNNNTNENEIKNEIIELIFEHYQPLIKINGKWGDVYDDI
jgi:hypothetical protein